MGNARNRPRPQVMRYEAGRQAGRYFTGPYPGWRSRPGHRLRGQTTGTLKSSDLYCSGEYTLHPDDFHAKATGAIVYTYPTGGFNLGLADFVLTIDDNQRNIHGVGFYVAATSLACVRLDGDRWLTISGGPDSLASTSIGTRPCPPRDNPPLIAGFGDGILCP